MNIDTHEERMAKIRAEHKADVDRAVSDPVFCMIAITSPEYRNAHSSRAYLLAYIASLEDGKQSCKTCGGRGCMWRWYALFRLCR